MIRRGMKGAVAAALTASGWHRLLGRLAGVRPHVLVLGYHRVVEDFDRASRHAIPAMLVSRVMLERHLSWVARTHTFVTLDEAARALTADQPPARPLAALTFDDGYADVHDVALPLLDRMGIPATVFVVTDLVGTDAVLAHDVLYALLREGLGRGIAPGDLLDHINRSMGFPSVETARAILGRNPLAATRAALTTMPLRQITRLVGALVEAFGPPDLGPDSPYLLTWEMVARLRAAGHGIGSHTRSHPFLTGEAPEQIAEEAGGSRAALQLRLGSSVRHFAYPDGRFTRGIVDAVAAAGYDYAWTVCSHRDARRPELALPRRLLWEKSCLGPRGTFSGAVMDCCAAGAFDLLSRCQMAHAVAGP
jgi:peptidoglycan/xylan/chitin deacetylase (PgdA/CDA1 family)